ncbi:MAG: LysM peptidoglycan-binding domain-containing protein [Bacteroidetes bacterium]|nr:LysM peptidoglycan-binding domain-containing protein [Bacteroidota bacterium]
MKFYKIPVLLLALSFLFSAKVSRAQDETKGSEDMDEDQWEAQILELTAKKNQLTEQLANMQKEVDGLTGQNNLKSEELKKAEDAYWDYFGGKDAYTQFKNDLDKLERQCRNKDGMKDEAQAKFDKMDKMKLKCHPEFADRFKRLRECLESWQTSVPEYTIQKGEYLFVIAAKKEIYNNHHMWPILWEANENGVQSAPKGIPKTIRNPHLVYPGQVLKVPKMTEALRKSPIFDRAKQWLDWKKNRLHKKKIIKDSTKDTKKTEEKKK